MTSSLVFSADSARATISDRVRRGELARIAPGIYTTAVVDVEGAVRAEWRTILGHVMPGAVITDRSAPRGAPVDGVLYVARPTRTRNLALPGIMVRTRVGPGAVAGDISLPGGIYQASDARGLLDNTRKSRTGSGGVPRTLSQAELGDHVERLARTYGPERIRIIRDDLESVAEQLGIEQTAVDQVNELLAASLGSGKAVPESRALAARHARVGYDPPRLELFAALAERLRRSAPQTHPADPLDPRWRHLPFFESYFSNFIEGTEFELGEAQRIIYEGDVPVHRPADAHDLLGTYEVVSDPEEMTALATDADQFLEVLRHRHAVIMAGRPETDPGFFKQVSNRAGSTRFVNPDLVEGTLKVGFEQLERLDTAWERAAYMMFLVTEIHPFNDGNGRTARVMMNAELVAGNEVRVIIPTHRRDDYVDSLRRLSRQADPSVYIKVLRYLHDITAEVDFTTLSGATAQLSSLNAFDEPDQGFNLNV